MGTSEPGAAPNGWRVRVLSLSCVYPNPSEPSLGVFVRRRLQALSRHDRVTVVAPVGVVDWARGSIRNRQVIPRRRQDGPIEVMHPGWLYAPGGLAINPVLLFLRLLPLVIGLHRRDRFDLIDAHFGYPDGVAAGMLAATLRLPFTVTVRGNATLPGQYLWRRNAMVWSWRRASAVIAVSARLRDYVMSMGVLGSQVKMIPNGVESLVFHPHDGPKCRRELGIPLDCKVILSAGALIERKGHHRIARALRALVDEGCPAQLVIAGGAGREGRYEDQIRREVRELGLEDRVRFIGTVTPEEMATWMSAADVFCLASNREGWPNVVHEASACGTPVVATDVGGVPDMVPSSDYGFVVPSNDAGALRDTLRTALKKDWDRAAISAWGCSRSWERVAGEVHAEFERIAGLHGRRCLK
ncbi:MAG: glycosyltransferase [Acidobacteria bacterium]|nr:glycosyltransferase [Acidobacteriota bacterium]